MESPTPDANKVTLATIGIFDGTDVKDQISVHFNPVSLQLAVSNELKEKGTEEKKQYIAKTTTKLTMDLIFDTTSTGEDVMNITRKIQEMVAPQGPPGQPPPKDMQPPTVQFDWGTIRFRGIAENYKETIDFFSANGVPLRSSLNLTLSRMDRIFDEAEGPEAADDVGGSADLFDAPAQSAADAGKNAKAPGAARGIAGMNGQASLRFGDGQALTVGASVELKAAVAFSAGAGAGLSLGGGGGLSLGGGAGVSLGGGIAAGGSAGFSVGGSAGASVSASAGISGLARLSATEGAFSGLRVSTSASGTAGLDPSRLVPKISSTTAAVDGGATFQVGGKALMQGSGGLRTDVGASGKLSFDAR